MSEPTLPTWAKLPQAPPPSTTTTPIVSHQPPPSRRPWWQHPVILVIIGISVGMLMMSFTIPTTPATVTPPSCIEALNIASSGFQKIGVGLGDLSASNLRDRVALDEATTWMNANANHLREVATDCRSKAE